MLKVFRGRAGHNGVAGPGPPQFARKDPPMSSPDTELAWFEYKITTTRPRPRPNPEGETCELVSSSAEGQAHTETLLAEIEQAVREAFANGETIDVKVVSLPF